MRIRDRILRPTVVAFVIVSMIIGIPNTYTRATVNEKTVEKKNSEGSKSGKDKKATCGAFAKMMSDVIKDCDSSVLSKWTKVAKKALNSSVELRRGDADLILYEAACVLGIGQGTLYWCDYVHAEGSYVFDNSSVTNGLFDNINDISPFECFVNVNAGWDYRTAATDFSLGNSSPADTNPFFDRTSARTDYKRVLSIQECETAAQRLKKAYECVHEGSFNISDYETDWSDKRLKDAYDRKNSIINSKTEIVKSKKYKQGKTYTGTAYYVSNKGDDANDGKSPDTPWATLEKVSDASLGFGDAVFFERGGVWYGRLQMREGVTYSAYGEGNKPVWSGSPLDAGDSSKWEYYGETVDGGKIWRYKEKYTDCGIVLLDNEIVCRKYYPVWNGKEYLTSDGKKKFKLKRELSADLMFYSDIDLTGYGVPCAPWSDNIKGDLYLRCDKGNPGDLFEKIELGVSTDNITTADGGYNTIDNICYRFMGLDCNCNDNIIFQNCESCWVGGSIKSYTLFNGRILTTISGGGMLLFGCNVTGRNNYIHDCESKGVAVVINGGGENGDGHKSLTRKNILANNNVIERCGMSLYMMTEFVGEGQTTLMEDITFKDNYIIESAKGWRMHSQIWLGNSWGTYGDDCSGTMLRTIAKTGKVLIKNNFYYGSEGSMVAYDIRNDATDKATFKNNKYILPAGALIFFGTREDGAEEKRLIATGTKKQIKKNIAELIGDKKAGFDFK